jgi:hypothetical protein
MCRAEIVDILEGQACIQCYDYESREELVAALIDSIECGDVVLPEEY